MSKDRPRSNLSLFEWKDARSASPTKAADARRSNRSRESAEAGTRIYRVSEVNRGVKNALESRWGAIWIEGELSDVTRSAAGHYYFTLNDEKGNAQLSAAIFRSDAHRLTVRPRDGLRVQVRGKLSLYEPRGRFQLIATHMRAAGEGDLAQKFEALKKKLAASGLMDLERKRPIPRLPRTIGVVTSQAGAAVHDIVRVASARFPVRIVVSHCQVQGVHAATTIIKALEAVQTVAELDVVILSRGGGSAEDLWAFNDEALAHAIVACRVPVISGVGHESDVTIADLVADVRAATPSNAAELAVPELAGLSNELEDLQRRLERSLEVELGRKRLILERMLPSDSALRRRATERRREVGLLQDRLIRRIEMRRGQSQKRIHELRETLRRHEPRRALAADRQALTELRHRLQTEAVQTLGSARRQHEALQRGILEQRNITREGRSTLSELAAKLSAFSPLSVLARGYAIALDDHGQAIRNACEVQVGDAIELRVHQGTIEANVTATHPEQESGSADDEATSDAS